uniref:Uncharacterized protein n=1 Tax=Arundo donax TaxID=35708 RepID=A0A0A9DUW8_ARUDO
MTYLHLLYISAISSPRQMCRGLNRPQLAPSINSLIGGNMCTCLHPQCLLADCFHYGPFGNLISSINLSRESSQLQLFVHLRPAFKAINMQHIYMQMEHYLSSI